MAHGHGVVNALDMVIYALDLVKHALDLVIYALDLVIYALPLVKYSLEWVIYALDPVNHALHLVALPETGSFPQLEPLDGFSRLWLKWCVLTQWCTFKGVDGNPQF